MRGSVRIVSSEQEKKIREGKNRSIGGFDRRAVCRGRTGKDPNGFHAERLCGKDVIVDAVADHGGVL